MNSVLYICVSVDFRDKFNTAVTSAAKSGAWSPRGVHLTRYPHLPRDVGYCMYLGRIARYPEVMQDIWGNNSKPLKCYAV